MRLALLLLAASSTVLAGPVLAPDAQQERSSYNNFSASCESITLYTPPRAVHRFPDQLKARCRDYAGTLHATTIDLNLCVGINYQNASLLWAVYGKFSEYCSACWPAGAGVGMACTCTPLASIDAKPTTRSVIDLDAGLGNVNGTLACAGGTGQQG